MRCHTAICYKFAAKSYKLTWLQIRVDKDLSEASSSFPCFLVNLSTNFIN